MSDNDLNEDDLTGADAPELSAREAWNADASAKSTPLFQPGEMDLYIDKVTMETYIFHGKKIDYTKIDHLEYDPDAHTVDVVKKDGSVVDLGVKIQWLLRPYWSKAKEVGIVQTKDGESVDGLVIPMIHKTKKTG